MTKFLDRLINDYCNLGQVHRWAGRYAEALRCLQKAIETGERLVRIDPEHAVHLRTLSYNYSQAGACHSRLAAREEERKALTRAVELATAAINKRPGLPGARGRLVDYHIRLGKVELLLGHISGTLVNYGKAVELDPNDALAGNNLAWLLATCADEKLRNPARAVELARKAVALKPKTANYWNTLGVACYRAGDWPAALTALEKSQQLGKGGTGYDWFFLAMTHWTLGHKEKARQYYDRAATWMNVRRRAKSKELIRFRREAGELIKMQRNPP